MRIYRSAVPSVLPYLVFCRAHQIAFAYLTLFLWLRVHSVRTLGHKRVINVFHAHPYPAVSDVDCLSCLRVAGGT